MRRSIHLTAVLLTLLLSGHAYAEAVVTQTYDVQRLLIAIPDFADAIDFKHGGSIHPVPDLSDRAAENADPKMANADDKVVAEQAAKRRSHDREATRSKLLSAVRFVLADVPGTSADEKDGSLFVSAAPAEQQRVARLISAANEATLKQVRVEAKVITIDAATCATLQQDVRDELDKALFQNRQPVHITDEQALTLYRAMEQSNQATILAGPTVTVFQNQQSWVLMATQRAFVSAVNSVTKKDGQTAFEPELKIVQSGTVLAAKPSVAADNSEISLTLRAQISQLLELKSTPAAEKPADAQLHVQVPVIRVLEATPTLTVKPGQSCIVPMEVAEGPAMEPGRMSFLIVKSSLILLPADTVTPSPASAK